MDAILQKFIEEATDLLADLEKGLLELEHSPSDAKLVERVFRAMHTLKGTSSMFGFSEIGHLTHDLETVYDLIRNSQAVFSADIGAVTFQVIDFSRELLLKKDYLETEENLAQYQVLLQQLKKLSNARVKDLSHSHEVDQRPGSKQLLTYHVSFKPGKSLLSTGTNPLYLIDDLCALGDAFVFPHVNGIPKLSSLDEHVLHITWDIFLATTEGEDQIRDIFLFAQDFSVVEVTPIGPGNLTKLPYFIENVKERLIAKSQISIQELQELAIKKSAKDGGPPQKRKQTSQKETIIPSVRVTSDKLDSMINNISELVTLQARLELISKSIDSLHLAAVSEDLEKLVRQLRETSMRMSLVPVDTLYSRFQRLVRDLSKGLGKDVVLITEGGDTELDKSIIESLTDPLLHLLRNSIDHGIEDTATREKLGKPLTGTITLRSYYSVGRVVITIEDDGKGIDGIKIKEKAIKKGFITEDSVLSEKELLSLIFLPGLSTTDKVTEVSGRGVGMDVVQQKIKDLRGEIEVTSHSGKGTRIAIKLPLSLSVLDGLLVEVADTYFVLPLSVTDKCYEISHEQLVDRFREMIVLNNEQVPFIYLRNDFRIQGEPPSIEQAITIMHDGERVAFIVDSIVGEYQAVLKPMTQLHNENDIVLGATIMGDGTIALVLDTARIISRFRSKVF